MKVLLLNITGRFGSTGAIVNDIKSYLNEHGYEALIVHGHPDKIEEPGFYQIDKPWESKIVSQLAKLGRAQYKGNPFALSRLKKIIKIERPDVVHVHCINGQLCNIYSLFDYLASEKIKTVITHHAEFFYTGSCAHAHECTGFIDNQCCKCPRPQYATFNRYFCNPHKNWVRMQNAVSKFKKEDLIFTAVSPWVLNRSKMSKIVNEYRGEVVMNGINTKIFTYSENRSFILKRIPNLKQKVVLHVTHQFAANDMEGIKGGGYVTLLAKRNPEISFIVAASDVIDVSGIPENMFIWGRTNGQKELAILYSSADVTLLTSKRETFSMVVAESLCCGTPVVGFEAGGPESIGIPEYCTFVKYGNTEALNSQILQVLNQSFFSEEISTKATALYSKECMGSNYLRIYKKIQNI